MRRPLVVILLILVVFCVMPSTGGMDHSGFDHNQHPSAASCGACAGLTSSADGFSRLGSVWSAIVPSPVIASSLLVHRPFHPPRLG